MDLDFSLSPDTQVILLLCSCFGRMDRVLAPLTPGQYNVFMSGIVNLGRRPADLMGATGPERTLIEQVCAMPNGNGRVKPASPDQIVSLLRRGMTLSTAIDKWSSYGVRVVSKADAAYPKRLREHLEGKAPTLLYYAGNPELFSGGGMAFVGSRDLNAEAEGAIRSVVRGCVDLGLSIVSGGARGADQTAMQEGASLGGKVIGALPCDLLKACLDPANRDALADGNALLFSAFDPEMRPFNYGQVAMDRNKYIYGMADYCFVAQSGTDEHSGTWAGAVEELKRVKKHPVYVFLGNPPSAGCLDLQKKGAFAWNLSKSVAENLEESTYPQPQILQQPDLFGAFSAAQFSPAYGEKKERQPAVASDGSPVSALPVESEVGTPYAAFICAVRDLLTVARKESEVKKRLVAKLDLVPAQYTRWLKRALEESVVSCTEYPVGKKGKTCKMLECVKGGFRDAGQHS